MPAFNAGATIAESIQSAWAQSCRPDEIIVGDDASTDRTREIARDNGAIVLELPKGNGAIARNRAAEKAKGDIFFFLDADDLWAENKIERHLETYESKHPGLILDRSQPFRDDDRPVSWTAGRRVEGFFEWQEIINHRHWPSGSGFSVTREAYWSVGGFNESLIKFQDVDFWVRCAHANPAYSLNEELTHYRIVEGSVSKQTKNHEPNLANVLKGWPFATDSEKRAFEQIAWMMMAERSKWPLALQYLAKAGSPVGNRFFWKCLVMSFRRTITG